MGNQEKAEKGDTVMSTSLAYSKEELLKILIERGRPLLSSTVVVLSAILGRIPTIDEYKIAVKGIKLTKFKPTLKSMT